MDSVPLGEEDALGWLERPLGVEGRLGGMGRMAECVRAQSWICITICVIAAAFIVTYFKRSRLRTCA